MFIKVKWVFDNIYKNSMRLSFRYYPVAEQRASRLSGLYLLGTISTSSFSVDPANREKWTRLKDSSFY